MNITEHTTVAEIASTLPASVRVFQRHGVDFCCGGRRPLAVVCAEQGVSFAEMARDIQTAAAIPPADARDWTAASLASLIDHIIATYHDVLRTELPRLDTLAAKAAQAHVSRAPFLVRVAAIVGELSGELRDHMAKEETVLFPAIRAVEVGHAFDAMLVPGAVAVLEAEHDRAGALLGELRRITDGYVAPDWSCATLRALYQGLAELEAAMHVHVHLENNVLFPRAIAGVSAMVR